MPENREIRPYKERLLDGFERSRIRTELQKVRHSRLDAVKKRYATMVLGASLAVGGIGLPLKSLNAVNAPSASDTRESGAASANTRQLSSMEEFSKDLKAANEIARSVTGGVTAAAETIASPLSGVTDAAAETAVAQSKETLKEAFFAKEVPFGKLIYNEAKKNDLRPELVAAVVQQESKFIPNARSHANAQGLMQLMPRTGRWMGAKNLMNPTENIKAGTKYLKYLNERFDGDERRVIAAYNAGEGNVKRFGGVPPFKETQTYVKKVLNFQQDYDDRLSGHVAEVLEQQLPSSR
jgi:soluble lytic murein transglycosylase-like protein